MRTLLSWIVVMVLLLASSGRCDAAPPSDSVYNREFTVTCSAGNRLVKAVYINLNDPNIKIEAAVACNQVGQVDELANIAGQLATPQREVLAAMNGTYFNPYGGMPLPWGTIQQQGTYVHVGSNGSTIGFTADNQVCMDNLNVTITGTAARGLSWYAWGLNHVYDLPDAVAIFTAAFGGYTGDHPYTSVIVEHGVVTQIKGGGAAIPQDGFVVVTGNRDVLSRFQTGEPAVYHVNFGRFPYAIPAPRQVQPWEKAITALSAGPTLVRDGNIVVDAAAEGFTEDKITTNRGLRNFIGETADHILVMATAPNVTVREEAEIARSMNLINAMNMDGNASAGLYYRGSYLTAPGRLLSNALVVTGLKIDDSVKVVLNGNRLAFDVQPIVDQGRTLVPLRGIFEAMGAEVKWDAQSHAVSAVKKPNRIDLQVGDVWAYVNGERVALDVAARIVDGRTLVPLRFVGESLGLQVEWDESGRTVVLTSK